MKKILILFILLNSAVIFGKEVKYISAKSGLRLRTWPSLKSRTKKIIPYNHAVLVLKKSRRFLKIKRKKFPWVKVRYRRYQGWISSGYIREYPVIMGKRIYNPSGSHYFMVKPEENSKYCAGYGRGTCTIKVYSVRRGKIVFFRKSVNPMKWINNRDILLKHIMGEQGYYESKFFKISIYKKKKKLIWSLVSNRKYKDYPGGIPESLDATVCYLNRCFYFHINYQTKKLAVYYLKGLTVYMKKKSNIKRIRIFRTRMKKSFDIIEKYNKLFFKVDNKKYAILYNRRKKRVIRIYYPLK